MNTDRLCLCISGDRAEDVREALLAKLVPPIVALRPFDVKTGVQPADMVETLNAHDSADFAAEKLLDALADRGWIRIPGENLTAVEERALRDRLFDLGYIE